MYVFQESSGNNRDIDGLWWFDHGGDLFSGTKPTIIFIHGNSWTVNNDKLSTYWPMGNFINNGWNTAAYRWKNHNSPVEALNRCAADLANDVIRIIDENGYDNNEIRFVGFSWGVFVSTFAAKKVIDHAASSGRKILVTVDNVEPVPTRASDSIQMLAGTIPLTLILPMTAFAALMGTAGYTDDEGNSNWGDQLIAHYLNHIAEKQVVGVKPGMSLFNVVCCADGYSWSDCPWSDFTHCTAKLVGGGRLEEKRTGYKYTSDKTWNHENGYRLYLDCDLSDYWKTRYEPA
jgi:hypothetical protein